MGSRSQTTFSWDSGFKESYRSLEVVVRAQILRSTKRFEQAWRNSNADNEIPKGFDFTPYPVDEPWRFIELHLGHDYRAFVMFPNGRLEAYWIHLFKKPGQKVPPKEISLAKSRAIDCLEHNQGERMMQKYENTQTMATTNDIIIHELTNENSGSTFVKEYLKSGFVSSAVDRLFYARRQACLTQAQVAEQMNTKQAAIARLESDADGSMSLRRYAEFALACGMVPLDITLVPIESARNFVISNPDLPLTQINYDTWLLTKETRFIPTSQDMQPTVTPGQPTITVSQTAKTSTQNRAEYGNQSLFSVGSEEQSTSNQYGGKLAA